MTKKLDQNELNIVSAHSLEGNAAFEQLMAEYLHKDLNGYLRSARNAAGTKDFDHYLKGTNLAYKNLVKHHKAAHNLYTKLNASASKVSSKKQKQRN
jgi:hypothetical protein